MVNEIPPGGITNPNQTTGSVPPTAGPDTDELHETDFPSAGLPQDFLLQSEEQEKIPLLLNGKIDLPAGRISIVELQKLIQETILKLKRGIIAAQQLNPAMFSKWHQTLAENAMGIERLHSGLNDTVYESRMLEAASESLQEAYVTLSQSVDDFNDYVRGLRTEDRAAIIKLRSAINEYNGLTEESVTEMYDDFTEAEIEDLLDGLTDDEIADLGGEEAAAVYTYYNRAIIEWNEYAASRPDIQDAIDELEEEVQTYNLHILHYNIQANSANLTRHFQGMDPYPTHDQYEMPDPDPLYMTVPEQPELGIPLIPSNTEEKLGLYLQPPTTSRAASLKSNLEDMLQGGFEADAADVIFGNVIDEGPYATESELIEAIADETVEQYPDVESLHMLIIALLMEDITPRYGLTLPTVSQAGTITGPTDPGRAEADDHSNLMHTYFLPSSASFLIYSRLFANALRMAKAEIDEENSYYASPKQSYTLPIGYFESLNPIIGSSGSAVQGFGLASAAMGLQSRNLQIALSRVLFRESATNSSIPISSRLFARLQFTAQEMLSKSSLMSSMPALRFISARLGSVSAQSPAVLSTISLAYAEQIGTIVSSGISRMIVNAEINRLGLYARQRLGLAKSGVETSQQALTAAIQAGGTSVISNAVDQHVGAEIELANATRLNEAFGRASLGQFASLTSKLDASLNLSLLGLTAANYARTLGIPDLVPLLFAQTNQIPSQDLLVALSARTGFSDVLESPLSLAFIKQMAADELVNRLGYTADAAATLANDALNRVNSSEDGLNTYSGLRDRLVKEFTGKGISPLQAYIVGNTTATSIRADVGARYLNTPFGIGLDASDAAAALVSSLFAQEANTANRLLQHSHHSRAELEATIGSVIEKSLSNSNSFETQRQFRDELRDGLRARGFSLNDSFFLANHVASYNANGSFIPAADVDAIRNAFEKELTGSGISIDQAGSVYNQALAQASRRAPFFSQDDFLNILGEEAYTATSALTGRGDGNYLFDKAAASILGASQNLSLEALTEQIGNAATTVLKPDLGEGLANKLKDQILVSILGGRTVAEAANVEERDPLSILNQATDQVSRLRKDEDLEEQIKMLRKLIQLLQKLATPNASIGYLLTSLNDNPGTFIGAANVSQAGHNYQALQIPV